MVVPGAEVVGQERAAAKLRAGAAAPVHAYLLVGPEGWGARSLVRAFAAEVLSAGLDADAAERVHKLVLEDNFADVVLDVEREGNVLRIEEVERLIVLAHRHPTESERKILVVPGFDRAGDRAWAQLLKVLEEPPPSTIWMLLADEVPVEMATITSRCAVIELDPVPPGLVADRLVAEGHDRISAVTAASAAAGDLGLARLLVGDERLALRVAAWRKIPAQLDGSGNTVWRLVGDVRAAIDDALAHVKSEFEAAERQLATHIDELHLPKGRLKALADSNRRQLRKARMAELRLGLATMAGVYRDALGDEAHSRRRADLVGAVGSIDETYLALLERNASEALQLQALLLRLPILV
ncbi:MAG: polymerase subunit delta [Nocardioidaceae bacterium]|nr:polymerase subunit delta [Nocardioidaceae bacterium]